MSRTQEDIQDELLVLQCQEGDDEALKELIGRWQPRLGRLAWRLTAEREAAHDIVQDTWLAIVRGINKLDDPARFRTWAYRIVSNKCADWTRRRVVQRKATRDLQNTAKTEYIQDNDTENETDRMKNALAKLPDEQRAILSLHYLDGMNVREISRVLGVPTGTVKSRLYHARKQLKEIFERTES